MDQAQDFAIGTRFPKVENTSTPGTIFARIDPATDRLFGTINITIVDAGFPDA
jgi:hypothetical protein